MCIYRREVKHKKLVCHTDSQVLFHIFHAQGSCTNLNITDYLKKVFWLQNEFQCKIDRRWMPSADNIADPITRVPVVEDLHLRRQAVWKEFGPFAVDLMASPSNVQRDKEGVPLPFVSQYVVKGATTVDVFSVDLGSNTFHQQISYCFQPFSMMDIFIAHLQECNGKCVVILPDIMGLWFPKYK